MTPSDWMKMGPSDWLDPTRSEQLYRQFSGWWERNYGYWMRPTKPSDWSRPQRDESCCRRCAPDSCDCFCCIGDVDFAVYARVGEQRVIPIIVENERRREKQITVEFSGWTTRGGKVAPVDTVLLEPKTFTLVPCGEQKVALVVKIHDDGQGGEQPDEGGRRILPDVDECVVATADLRLVGCDHRPIRIAVAILPRYCDPYRVTCGCTCC
ncbi:MAG: hypothetical protein ACRETU_09015 [Steroidobacterales bacterium]